MAKRWVAPVPGRVWRQGVCALLSLWIILGCGGSPSGTTDPEEKLRLERLLQAYQMYADRHRSKGPPNEQSFKEFLQKLSPEEKAQLQMNDNADELLTSPRDGQKYVIRYGATLDPGGATRAIAWEKTGKDGKRYVALNMGYVEEYDEKSFKEIGK